jgi:hypothetical protein
MVEPYSRPRILRDTYIHMYMFVYTRTTSTAHLKQTYKDIRLSQSQWGRRVGRLAVTMPPARLMRQRHYLCGIQDETLVQLTLAS